MKDVQGKVGFITGGGSGIGLAIAQAFINAGMKVVLADLRQDHLDQALAGFRQRDQLCSIHPLCLDVTDRSAMAAAASETVRAFGKSARGAATRPLFSSRR
jgi:NADP-dependent 3-hydroxy acid dehydrogenase YdfG